MLLTGFFPSATKADSYIVPPDYLTIAIECNLKPMTNSLLSCERVSSFKGIKLKPQKKAAIKPPSSLIPTRTEHTNYTSKVAVPAQNRPSVASYAKIKRLIVKWANHYGANVEQLLRVADCESSFNPLSVNRNYFAGGGNPSGLFQYLPETWARISKAAGFKGDIWNANDQARLTAWAFIHGYSGEWECR